MLRRVGLVRSNVSEEPSAFSIKLTTIGELGTTLAVTSNRRSLRRDILLLHSVRQLLVTANVVPTSPILINMMMQARGFSETSVLTRTTRHYHIPEYSILHCYQRENINTYIYATCSYCFYSSLLHTLSVLWAIIRRSNKQTPWPLVRERTIPTERPPLVDEI
jgi:hypothetical protein